MSKVVVKGMDIPLDQIKPSPYQPRLNFDLEDIRESIKRDGILIGLTVRKKEGYYELIDGERRLRLAKELGYEAVPCDVVDIDDETARRMVYKVNKARKNYTPYEEAVFFRKLVEEEEMKPYEVETQLGADHQWVQACLNVWKFPKDIQDNVFGLTRGSIPYRVYMTDVRELEPVINRNLDEAVEILRQVIKERMTADEKKELIRRREKKIEEETIQKAEEAIREVVPELKKPETPEEFVEAAEALREEAERRKTPEQKEREAHQKKVDAVLKSLLSGKVSVPAKIKKAKELGLDTTEFDGRMENIKAEVDINPEGMKDAVNELKMDIDEARKEREEEIEMEKNREAAREMLASFPRLGEYEDGVDVPYYKSKLAEIEGYIDVQPDKAVEDLENLLGKLRRDRERERIRKEEAEKARKEVTEELLKDTDFLRKAAEMAPTIEEIAKKEEIRLTPPSPSLEEMEAVRERLRETRQRIQEIMDRPEVKERGIIFRNLMAHEALLDVLGSATCPICEANWENLEWKCHHLNVKQAYEKVDEKYRETLGEGKG